MNRMTRRTRGLLRAAALCCAAAVIVLWLSGCVSMPTGEKFFIAAVAADTATTVYGLTATDNLHEAGPLHGSWGDDDAALVSALVVDAAILYFVHRLYRRYPDSELWPSIWFGAGSMKAFIAARNIDTILEADD